MCGSSKNAYMPPRTPPRPPFISGTDAYPPTHTGIHNVNAPPNTPPSPHSAGIHDVNAYMAHHGSDEEGGVTQGGGPQADQRQGQGPASRCGLHTKGGGLVPPVCYCLPAP